jgi:DNA-binding GntR family transcriptional regulator
MRAAEISDRIESWVRGAIASCELLPGAPLRQDRIAARFGTSKLPVREALRRLEALDYVEFHPRRGFMVKRFSRQEIIELFEICALFEGQAVQTGASRLSPSDLRRLDECVERLSTSPSLLERLKADSEFHLGLVAGSRNATIRSKLEDFHAYFRMYYRATGAAAPAGESETYRLIVSDLRDGNIVAASARLQVYLFEQGRRLSELGADPPQAVASPLRPASSDG